jgi:tRNA (guanine37-N1)-methyltransferase
LILVCGRYEGIDDRVRELAIDEELSIGDFVLSGGEPAAMVVIDALSRYVPGVLGEATSTDEESFSEGLLEHPQFTRPPEFRGARVPDVLLSGDHERVRVWRAGEARRRTRERRPDLWARRPESRESSFAARTFAALVHHPVVDRSGRIVTTAVTNLDIHDIARASKTFGLAGYFVVTPVEAQRELVGRILGHWSTGAGREHNDKRTEALENVRVVPALDDARRAAGDPIVVATGARPRAKTASFAELEARAAAENRPVLLVFGTGWGLAEEVFEAADLVLPPISGPTPYNHLSVRSAVAIVLDRLFGNRNQ